MIAGRLAAIIKGIADGGRKKGRRSRKSCVKEMIFALVLFAITYVLMLVFSKYRPYIALGSAALFIATGMLPLQEILPSIDLNVILMIAGTMAAVIPAYILIWLLFGV